MESSRRQGDGYTVEPSVGRINQILSGADTAYEEVNQVPGRERLTFTNGFYVNCSAIWVDMRESSKLTEKYQRPRLAKLYRAYISEMVPSCTSRPVVSKPTSKATQCGVSLIPPRSLTSTRPLAPRLDAGP